MTGLHHRLRAAAGATTTDSRYIAVSHFTSPFVSVYPWSGSGFGSKYSNPTTLPPDDGTNVAFGG
jgi:hypothetical protein